MSHTGQFFSWRITLWRTQRSKRSLTLPVYISVEKTQKAEVAVLTIIGDGGRKGSE